ncbi:MAG: hypothetical protein A2358_03885 [Candidatus Staskawiczbacteria bacterium RIFOXYB1_FULL_37_44]|uniref:GlcNAc-PI de-N-acetylase n=1 Tax=Candidatus Staskawiczbacteria bacterium RIFOXYB1_FULL_37_44 TaxID=1802223 RepID=A0A1G2IWY4_9BACT|nr:MAG: hypothetical protein A2358_03885 [Candidatus Staskawiczbacteria bacterium RIFOXYB1_FULL_37_44]OGZ83773.1 MAG: hypothetical protein A2416_00120 [Candidatus Staskawiczbacteria bacterium RIFOXYC1_FULL_37_52]OGZ88845.1 MAG: hypothetical protein A2444_03405 [Candidatus Staskawiczbacteria bacterium RIFOXYC2_FULL_37_19]
MKKEILNKKPVLLAVMAHPDDAELKCYGTLCKYSEMGFDCVLLIICSGENGISLNDKKNLNVKSIPKNVRLEETITAFKNTSVHIDTLNFDDGNIFFGRKLIEVIEQKMREYKPEIVIAQYGDSLGVDHQDHGNAGRATVNCATRLDFVKKILLCEPLMTLRSEFTPNYFIDITKYFPKKIKALASHKSQEGRYYLEEEYHNTKADFYATSVSYNKAREGNKYEAFKVIYQLDD